MLDVIPIFRAREFWAKVDVRSDDECWPWMGLIERDGYGDWVFRTGNGTRPHLRAHRVAYTLERGEIPEGLVIDHLCRVRNCCNPAHLEPVTNEENIRRGTPMRGTSHNRAELVAMYAAGMSLTQLAELTGMSRGGVTYRLRIAGVAIRQRGRPAA